MRSVLPSLLFTVLATPALSSDGVLEINQTCAVQTGCFSGDTAGWPVTIGARGSYRLTSNLTLLDPIPSAIIVDSDDVGLDLNGFSIVGPVSCGGAPITCAPTDGFRTAWGVNGNGGRGISVRNGRIIGMGVVAVGLGDHGVVENLQVRWNRMGGIVVADGSIVSGSTAYENGREGIQGGNGTTIFGNSSYRNGSHGISVITGSNINENSVSSNEGDGIHALSRSTILHNAIADNAGAGVLAGDESIVRDTNASGNGGHGISVGARSLVSDCATLGNTGNGIVAGAAASVQRSVSRNNAAGALNLDPTATYRENTVGGVVGGVGINMGDNSCNGTTTCP